MSTRSWKRAVLGVAVAAALPGSTAQADETRTVYDDFNAPGYSYDSKWTQSYGPLSLAAGATRSFDGGRRR